MADKSSHITHLTQTQGKKELTANNVNDAESTAATLGVIVEQQVGFSFAVYGGKLNIAGTPTAIANQVLDLSAHPSTTVYIYLTSLGVVTITTSIPASWPGPLASSAVGLYTVTTGADGVTDWVDWRTAGLGGSATLADVLAALQIDGWVWGTSGGHPQLTITKSGESTVLDFS